MNDYLPIVWFCVRGGLDAGSFGNCYIECAQYWKSIRIIKIILFRIEKINDRATQIFSPRLKPSQPVNLLNL